jgi:8-oxo-dGTP diphosphatase
MQNLSKMKQACMVIIIGPDSEILLLKRSDKMRFAPGKWYLPGGKLDFLEEPVECASRELEEELGVQFSILAILYAGKTHYKNRNLVVHTHFIKVNETFAPTLNEEHSDHCWVPLSEVFTDDNFDTPVELRNHIDNLFHYLTWNGFKHNVDLTR